MQKKKKSACARKELPAKKKRNDAPRISVNKLIDQGKRDKEILEAYSSTLDDLFEITKNLHNASKAECEGMLTVVDHYLDHYEALKAAEGKK